MRSNESAFCSTGGLGFKEVGQRKGYYGDSEGDGTALVMRIDLR